MSHQRPNVFSELMSVIEDRKHTPSEKSYTSSLFTKGLGKIGAKVVEEAAEVVEAAGEAGEDGRQHTLYETADLLYHLFVLAAHSGISFQEIEDELVRRFGISGLEEKASRLK